jgi:hypothetical protein
MYAIYAIFIILHKDGMKWNDHSNGNGCQMWSAQELSKTKDFLY